LVPLLYFGNGQKIRRAAFLLILLILGSSRVLPQNCSVLYYQNNFHHLGSNGYPGITILPDNTLYLSSESNSLGLNIVKLKSTGDTLWSHIYINGNGTGTLGLQKTLLDVDGNLFCVLNNNYLARMDTAGNVLSTQMISGLSNYYFMDAAILPSGDKILFFSSNGAATGGILARVDPSLSTVKWCVNISFYSSLFSNILVDGNTILIAGGASALNYSFDLNSFVGEWNLADGSLKKLRYFVGQNSLSNLKGIYKAGSGYFLDGYLSTTQDNLGNFFYLRLDTALNLLKAKRIINSNPSSDFNFIFLPENDGSLYGAFGGNFDLALFYLDNRDSVEWTKLQPNNLSYPADLKQSPDGLFVTGVDNYNNVVTSGAESIYVLTKSDFEGNLVSCQSQPEPPLTTSDYLFTQAPLTVSMSPYSISLANSQTTRTDYPLDGGAYCSGSSVCQSIRIIGDTILCNNQPLVFTGRKNTGCSSQVHWEISPQAGFLMNPATDSTLSLQFNTSGTYLLKSSLLNSCSSFRDSVQIHVNLADVVGFGKDTTLCSGNGLILHAGPGFKSYSWQDGSTDSVFALTKSGKYYVTVTDYCNHIFSDTIRTLVSGSPPIHLGKDTSLCQGQYLTVDAGPGFSSYQWSTGARTEQISINSAGYFSVSAVSFNGCSSRDTIRVLGISPSPDFTLSSLGDTTLCQTAQIDYSFNIPGANFLWNDGSTDPWKIITQTGEYSLSVSLNGCTSTDSVHVIIISDPQANLGNDTTLCQGETRLLDATNPGASYTWQDGSKKPVFLVDSPGTYQVTVDDFGCVKTFSTVIQYLDNPSIHFKDSFVCKGMQLLLDPVVNTQVSYQWQDGSTLSSFLAKDTGTYTLSISNLCGTATRSVHVNSGVCQLTMPNAFTPNGDGINDLFRVPHPFPVNQFSLTIYNRWGQKVFETRDISQGWDGKLNGVGQPQGGYVWYISLINSSSDKQSAKGTVLLIR
jgi:gliding motility-associated-like protein